MEDEKNLGLFKELWLFLKERKAWWLTPIIILLIIFGSIIMLGSSSPLSPLIYTLF